MNHKAAWYLAQLVAGLKPKEVDPDKFTGPYLEAIRIFRSSNGQGPKQLQSWLAMPEHRAIRDAVLAHRPGSPTPIDDARTDFHLTDMGNAERLADLYAHELRYVREWDWMVYRAGRWERNPLGAHRRAKLTVRHIYGEAETVEDDKQRKAIAAWAYKSEANTRIAAMLALAQSEQAMLAMPTDFDLNPMLFNCRNGVVDLQTGKLRPPEPGDLFTRMAGCDYDPKAKCPNFLRFLETIFGGNQELVDYVQRAGGYALTGDTSEQALFFCYGSGRNGKSTLLETLRAVLGDYGQQAEASAFLLRQSDGVRNDIARMAGVRFVAAIEVGEGRRLNETLVKQVTGQDTLTARFLHREFFEFVPQFKLWMAANHKPVIRGTDEAIWRRIRLIPFQVTIPIKQVDRKLRAVLQAEASGILTWLVDGCRQWQRSGLKDPEAVRAATKEYRAEMDVIAAFIDECCIVTESATATAPELYRAYKAWAELNNEAIENQRSFGLRLGERDFEKTKANGVHTYRGIGLIDRNHRDE